MTLWATYLVESCPNAGHNRQHMTRLTVETAQLKEIIDITSNVEAHLSGSGMVYIYCPHTTAGIAINEISDPDVRRDYLTALDDIITCESQFHHAEGNSKAHVSAIFTGCGQWVPYEDGKLVLGRWQGVWFCEFDGPRKREVWVTIQPNAGESC